MKPIIDPIASQLHLIPIDQPLVVGLVSLDHVLGIHQVTSKVVILHRQQEKSSRVLTTAPIIVSVYIHVHMPVWHETDLLLYLVHLVPESDALRCLLPQAVHLTRGVRPTRGGRMRGE